MPSVVAQCLCACPLSLSASTADWLPLPAACCLEWGAGDAAHVLVDPLSVHSLSPTSPIVVPPCGDTW